MARELLFLGVDGGATRCRARLRDLSGADRAEAEGPAANAYVGFDSAIAVARAVVDSALRQANLRPEDTSCVSLGLGLAGISNPAEAARFAAAFPGFANVRVANDAVTACRGAHAGMDGGLLIAGTGSAGIARVGADAVRAALRAHDGLGPSSSLTAAILAHFQNDAAAMTIWALGAKPGDYGAFAPLVIEAAAAGDAVARPIVESAARAVEALAHAVTALGASQLVMVGGLGAAIRPFLSPDLDRKLRAPRFDPTDGAILLAGGTLPAIEGRPSP